MEAVRCGLCHSPHHRTVWSNLSSWEHPGHFRLVKCRRCGFLFLNPRPTRSEIGQYYPPETYWGSDVQHSSRPRELESERERSYGFLYTITERWFQPGKVLDIGAGTGLFLSGLSLRGWQSTGVEFSTAAVEFGQNALGENLMAGDFLDFSFPAGEFQLVTLNNSLEHLFDPLPTLQAIFPLLPPGGGVLITVPNAAGLGRRLFGQQWYAWQPPRHLSHFTPQTLTLMLRLAGFEVKLISHWYWIHNYAAIFESFRLKFSPRFQKQNLPKGATQAAPAQSQPPHRSLKKSLLILGFKAVSVLLAALGALLGRGETITVLARKRSGILKT